MKPTLNEPAHWQPPDSNAIPPLEAGDRLTRDEFERRHERLSATDDGVLRSRTFPGLWLHAEALLRGDLAAVLASLQAGIVSPEHQAFVERLSASH
jgi:hypothetical protein